MRPAFQRLPSTLLLVLAAVTFVGSILLLMLPFDVSDAGPDDAAAPCGPPLFEVTSGEYATPSTVAPPGTTIPLPPTTPPTTIIVFGVPVTNPPPPTLATLPTIPTSTTSTLPTELVREVCSSPASQRTFFGILGLVAAAVIGYFGRRLRAQRYGYVVR